MTQFWKEGHYRTNTHGRTFWVNGHWVERHDWNRVPSGYTPNPLQRDFFLDRYPEFRTSRRVSACFVNPNARCPVCDESVYYYQNEHGSRVFFDELGPPWPKHSCTDSQSIATALAPMPGNVTFETRSRDDVSEISKWTERSGHDFASEFRNKYEVSPWPLATIVKRLKSGKRVFLILELLQRGRSRKVYLSCKTLPKCCQERYPVAIRRRQISLFDPAKMVSMTVPVRRYRGAAAFIDAMIDPTTTDS